MNSVSIVGRLTKDPDVRYTDGGTSIARFTVAVDRRFKKEGEESADFIGCIAFGKTAEFIEKYFGKGKKIGLTGRIQTGHYTNKDGKEVYTTDVIAEAVEFVESKGVGDSNSQSKPQGRPAPADANGFVNIPDNVDDAGLPFA
jgi:single-strand DNA-binding protein